MGRAAEILKPDVGVQWYQEKDRWNNDVSIITTEERSYRMVHHNTNRRAYIQRAKIYGGPNKFFTVEFNQIRNDCQEEHVKVGPWEEWYGDGEPLDGKKTPPGFKLAPDGFKDCLQGEFFLAVLRAVEKLPGYQQGWESKPPREQS